MGSLDLAPLTLVMVSEVNFDPAALKPVMHISSNLLARKPVLITTGSTKFGSLRGLKRPHLSEIGLMKTTQNEKRKTNLIDIIHSMSP